MILGVCYYVGMKITLNIGESEYIGKIASALGAMVLVHSNKNMPHPEQQGFLVKPGEIISGAVKKVSYFKTMKSSFASV